MLYRLVLVVLFLSLAACTDNEETLKIQRDLANIQEQIYEIEKTQADLKEELLAKARDIDRKLDDRTGEAEVKNDVKILQQRLDQAEALIYDLETKLVEMRNSATPVTLGQTTTAAPGNTAASPDAAPDSSGQPDGSTVTVSGNMVEQQFNKALLDYNRGKFDVAVDGFSSILADFPDSPYTEPSHYYLGVSYFQRKKYQQARDNFYKITSTFPNGDFIRQARLYEGQCYYYLNQHSRAIITLRDLIDSYEGTQEAALALQFLKKTGYER
ncbi:MAG: tetratricopeptide repeat protein [Acidobacteriota bacterium]|nr:tetratricopeptide repeat protein [Acidobacteriota bacterium]